MNIKVNEKISEMVLSKKEQHVSKLLKMPVCLCINGTREMAVYKYDLEKSISSILSEIRGSELEKYVDIGVVFYSEGADIKPDFKNAKDIKDLKLELSGEKPETDKCLYTVMTKLSEKLGDYRITGNYYCKPVIVLITSAVNDTFSDKTKKYILEKRRNNAVYIISVLVSEQAEAGELKAISDRVLKGDISDLPEILSAIIDSMNYQSRSSTSSAYAELLDDRNMERWSRFLV